MFNSLSEQDAAQPVILQTNALLDFCTQEYYGSLGSADLSSVSFSEETSSAYVRQGLDKLGLAPDDRAVNLCLLGVLPDYRRRGVARQILQQVISSARSVK